MKTLRETTGIFVVLLLLSFGVGALYGGYSLDKTDPLERYAVSPYNNTGQPESNEQMPELYGRVMRVREREHDGLELIVHSGGRNVLVRADSECTPAEIIGRKIRFYGVVELPSARRNPGCFDYRMYLMTMDVRVIVKNASVTVLDHNDVFGRLYHTLCGVKYKLLVRAAEVMSARSYGLFAGMMFGDKSEMGDELYGIFQKSGIAHILSVSGMHVAIVYAFIGLLFGKRRNTFISLLIAAALIAYAVLSEFSPSVVRAVTMILVHILSKLTLRRYDLLTGVCFAGLFMLLQNPVRLFAVGFQLSFLAVLLLAFGLPLTARFTGYRDRYSGRELSGAELDKRLGASLRHRLTKDICTAFCPIIIIQFGMAPLTAWAFNYLSPVGLLLNIPVAVLAGLILPAGVIMLLLSVLIGLLPAVPSFIALSDAAFAITAHGTQTLIDGLVRITEFADSLKYGHFQVVSPPVWTVLLFYGLLFLLMSEGFRVLSSRRRTGRVTVLLVFVICAGLLCAASPYAHRSEAALHFVDVGQGDCLHVQTPDGKNYLIDGGGQRDYNVGEKVLLPYLLKNGISELDGVFLSHLHMDHYKGIKELSEHMDTGPLFVYDGNRVRPEAVARGSAIDPGNIVYLAEGDRVELGKGVVLDVLYPPAGSMEHYDEIILQNEDENSSSLLMRIDYDGVSTLMTGDLGEEGEQAIGAIPALKCDILKVGHHGSRTSTTDLFLAAVAPDYAVIQVGRNVYGHPTVPVLEKLRTNDIMVFRNDLDAALTFKIREGKIIEISGCDSRVQTNRKRF